MTVPQSDPVCARCGKPLPEYWVWCRDRHGKRTGQAACGGCARKGEKAE